MIETLIYWSLLPTVTVLLWMTTLAWLNGETGAGWSDGERATLIGLAIVWPIGVCIMIGLTWELISHKV